MSPAPHLPVLRFSTDAVPPRERHDLWQWQGAPSIGRLLEARAEPGFEARSETLFIGPLIVSIGRYGAQWIARTPALIRRAPVDHLHIAVPLDVSMVGESVIAPPGSALVLDFANAWQHRAATGSMAIVVMPRALALAHGIDPRAVHGARIAPAAAMLLREHLIALLRQGGDLPATAAPHLVATIVGLVAVALAAQGCTVAPAPAVLESAHKARAKRLIAAALEQPSLDVAFLVGALGVSRSSLYRMFEAEGGVRTYIRRQRLLAARALLSCGGSGVAEVAARLWFSDASHFSRIFTAEFGVNPGDWRAHQRSAAP